MTLTLAPHRATTRHLASLYLLQADRHFDGGPLLGLDVRSGATFCFEPFTAYASGLITNPNLLVLGEVGSGKSTVAKLLSWAEQALLGRSVAILDPKGEYGALARLLGLPSLRLSPGGRARINPLELADSAGVDEHDRRRTEILSALGESGLGRALRPEERASLDVTLTELSPTPMLGSVVERALVAERLCGSSASHESPRAGLELPGARPIASPPHRRRPRRHVRRSLDRAPRCLKPRRPRRPLRRLRQPFGPRPDDGGGGFVADGHPGGAGTPECPRPRRDLAGACRSGYRALAPLDDEARPVPRHSRGPRHTRPLGLPSRR